MKSKFPIYINGNKVGDIPQLNPDEIENLSDQMFKTSKNLNKPKEEFTLDLELVRDPLDLNVGEVFKIQDIEFVVTKKKKQTIGDEDHIEIEANKI